MGYQGNNCYYNPNHNEANLDISFDTLNSSQMAMIPGSIYPNKVFDHHVSMIGHQGNNIGQRPNVYRMGRKVKNF